MYSRVTFKNTRFSLMFEHLPSSSLFVIFLSSLSVRSDPRYARSLRCYEQVLYSRDIFFPRLISILKTFSSFVRSRPCASPSPASLPYALLPLEYLLRLFTNYRTHFHPSVALSLSLGISFQHIGRKSTCPVCSVVNGSPRGRRSARHSGNKEPLLSSLYSTLCLGSRGNHYRYYFSEFLTFCSSQCV